HHLHMPVPPLHESLIEIHEPLGNLRDVGILLVDLDENPLHLRRFLVGRAVIPREQLLRHRILVCRKVMKESIPQRRLAEPLLDAFPVLAALLVALERRPPLLAEYELDLAKLMRLKTAA